MKPIELAKKLWDYAVELKPMEGKIPGHAAAPLRCYPGILSLFAGVQAAAESKDEGWINDVKKYHVDTVVMGGDWAGSDRFEYLKEYCEVMYLDRTEGLSTTKIKKELGLQEPVNGVDQIPKMMGTKLRKNMII